MRIVFDNLAFAFQKRGGVSVVWKELVSRFIVNRQDNLTFVEYEPNKENMCHEELAIPPEWVLMRKPLWMSAERFRDINLKIDEPFIFHSSEYRVCKNKKAINVVTVHDFIYEVIYKGKRKGASLHIWQQNRAIKRADAVVCISESTKRDLMKYLPNVSKDKLYVIHNAASSEYRVLSKEGKIEGIKDWLLFVGGRGAYKNGRWFAECIKDTKYKVIFCGNPMSEDEIVYYNSVLGVDRYQVKVGLSNEELNRYYNSVKCLVYPSSYEGFGIPVLEAQQAGCPVIALNTSSIPEVIGDTPLLMNELKKEELLEKLELLDRSDVCQRVIEKGIENAKRFSWDKAYSEYRKMYSELFSMTCKFNLG